MSHPAHAHPSGETCKEHLVLLAALNEPAFSALQIVWPDLQRRFPWQTGCDNPYPQPVLAAYGWEWAGEDAIARPKS